MSDRQPPQRTGSSSSGSASSARPLRWEGGAVSVSSLANAPFDDAPSYDLVLWVEAETEHVVAVRFVAAAESSGAAADLLLEAIRNPRSGPARRPAEVCVREEALARQLRAHPDLQGIEVAVGPECRALDTVVAEFGAFLAAHWPGRSYLAGEEVTASCLERFFHAAAAFYRRAPWDALGEIPIELRLTEREQPVYAVVVGSVRNIHGLVLHFSSATLPRLDAPDRHVVRAQDTLAVTFDREDGIPPPMLEERRAHRWPLAGPAAFPLPHRRLADGTLRDPTAAEFSLLTTALHAVAEFVKRHPAGLRVPDTLIEAVQVEGGSGTSIARLTYPAPGPASAGAEAAPNAEPEK